MYSLSRGKEEEERFKHGCGSTQFRTLYPTKIDLIKLFSLWGLWVIEEEVMCKEIRSL